MNGDWTKFYYVDPRPNEFVAEVRRMAAERHLSPTEAAFPTIVFLSCVIAANPGSLAGWLENLEDLGEGDQNSLELAVSMSGVPWPGVVESKPVSWILDAKIDHPVMLDALWLYYFATGELRAVRRIISVLEWLGDFGAARRFRETAQTAEDQARALRDGMFQAASWSLRSLMKEHSPLKDFCGSLVRSNELSANERTSLAMELEHIDPANWHVKLDSNTGHATITWTMPP